MSCYGCNFVFIRSPSLYRKYRFLCDPKSSIPVAHVTQTLTLITRRLISEKRRNSWRLYLIYERENEIVFKILFNTPSSFVCFQLCACMWVRQKLAACDILELLLLHSYLPVVANMSVLLSSMLSLTIGWCGKMLNKWKRM